MVSLTFAGAFFSVGLCLFVYASQQSLVTRGVITAFAAIHAIGLLALYIYFNAERWMFRRNADITGLVLTVDSFILPFLDKVIQLSSRFRRAISNSRRSIPHEDESVRPGPTLQSTANIPSLMERHTSDPEKGSRPTPLNAENPSPTQPLRTPEDYITFVTSMARSPSVEVPVTSRNNAVLSSRNVHVPDYMPERIPVDAPAMAPARTLVTSRNNAVLSSYRVHGPEYPSDDNDV